MITEPLALSGRTAVVTGASRGIGYATAASLLRQGAKVVITSRAADRARAAAESLGAGAVGIEAHATDEAAARRCIAVAVREFGSVDILVNNAGANVAFGPLVELDHGAFTKTIDVSLWAPLLWSGIAWRETMRENGGVIVNVASIGGLATGPGTGAYRAAKAGLIHLTRQLADELAPSVRVNAVAPGLVRTRMARALWEPDEGAAAQRIPLGRIGEPAEIADAITFLAGDGGRWITGETLVVDGGQLVASLAPAADQDETGR